MRFGFLRWTTLVVISGASLGAAGCSSDDKAADNTAPATTPITTAITAAAASDPQRQAIIDRLLSESASVGYALDEVCLRDLVDGLDDADVSILATSATDPSGASPASDLSAEGQTLDPLSCATGSTDTALITDAAEIAIAAASEGTTTTFDRACVEEAFGKATDAQLDALVDAGANQSQQTMQPVLYLMLPCSSEGSTATSG